MDTEARTAAMPRYSPDPVPPVTLPPGRCLGAATGVQVTPDGHIWVLHIASNMEWGPPGSTGEGAARLPAVCEFDAEGNYLGGWGGPDWLPREGGFQQWPRQEETISFDDEGAVWVFGADVTYDHAVQRFTRDGKLLLRIGRYGDVGDDRSPDRLGCPTDCYHDVGRREVYITDGYVNHRVAVFNSDTGEFLRAFGAYAQEPRAGSNPSESFNNPVHAILRGPEGHLYVCDRKNDRIQVFDALGRDEPVFVREIGIDVESPFGATFNSVFTPEGKFMVANDGSNSRLWAVDLDEWKIAGSFMAPNSDGVDLSGTVHKIASDHAGNLLLARTSKGIERMRYEGSVS